MPEIPQVIHVELGLNKVLSVHTQPQLLLFCLHLSDAHSDITPSLVL